MRRALLIAAGLLSLGVGGGAGAAIPSAEKIADAVAATNRAAGRSEPLWLEVTLRIGEGEPVASGVLATHPTGLARLELRHASGFVERHLLQGNAYSASRDGRMLRNPRPFLPPLFLLQATSGAALRAALESFGVSVEEVELGRIGDRDCYVLGGRAIPKLGGERPRRPSLWIDLESYQVVRIDRADGVRFGFGPPDGAGGSGIPRWIAIEVPGQPPVRLEIQRVAPANAPAAAFGIGWLTAPAGGAPAGAGRQPE